MIEFIKKQDNNSLILFIHGFTGGDDTWSYSKVCSFPQLLADDLDISSSYDIATFSYYTKLSSTYSKTLNIGKFISNLFRTSHKKLKSNSSIEEISNLLRTEIRFNLASYDNIVVVAHSMGGLVTKSAIVKDIEDNSVSKIKLFLSLSVPHQGADAATFGSLVSKNIQIENLAPLNDFIHKINDFWLKTSLRPTTKYFYGVSDKVVSKTSAVPIDKEKSDVISVEENHTSITKPENVNNTTYCAVKQLILEHKNGDAATTNISIQKLDSDSEFSDELFVLKLLSANIHDSTIRSAKELYLNAEYIRKIFSSESDQKRLSELYHKIKTIYCNSYTKYVHDGIANSGLLLADVHENIIKEDKDFLYILIPFMSAIHKQGMIHQLANIEGENVWWCKEANLKKELAVSKLPYIQPDKDKYYNLGIVLILLNSLSRTKRGKLNITVERLQIFYFLVTRPVLMNQVLSLAGKKVKELEEVDVYSVSTISQNVDELFDKNKIRLLLKERKRAINPAF